MKKVFSGYAAIWAVLVVVFNIISFVSPGWIGIEKYSESFWIGYAVITFAFLGQLCCAWKAFGTDSLQRFFYNVPLIRISYAGLIATFVFAGLCMFLSLLWGWVALIVCFVIIAITVLAIIKAGTAGEIVAEIDNKVKEEIHFIKLYSIKAEELKSYAKTEIAKTETKKIAEAFRYSDPVSAKELEETEVKIRAKFEDFENAVKTADDDETVSMAEGLERLIRNRNDMCKIMK